MLPGIHIKNARNLCELFSRISASVWKKVSAHHDYFIQTSEIGLTKDIMFEVIDWVIKNNAGQCFIYDAVNEPQDGNDIELYIKNSYGIYDHYALQAKVLKVGDYYDGLDNGLNSKKYPDYQWNKLNQYSIKTKCIPFYLLYNGVTLFKHTITNHCINEINENQYGCSLVNPDVFRTFWNSNNRNPRFNDIHPTLAYPWTILTCCDITSKYPDHKAKTINEVLNATKGYTKINKKGDPDFPLGIDKVNKLSDDNEKNEWKSSIIIVVDFKSNISN